MGGGAPDGTPDDVRSALERLGCPLERAAADRLARYLALLLDTNRRMNLTAVRDPGAAWHRLIVDSLTLLPALAALPAGAPVIDVGSGGGLPGIPVAIARPDLALTLVEATGKKCEALRGFVAALGLENVRVRAGRAETLAHEDDLRERFAVAVSRALGPLAVVLELTLPFVAVSGRAIAMKGPSVDEELPRARAAAARLGGGGPAVAPSYPADFLNALVLVTVEKRAPTSRRYPRPPGVPKKEPL